MITIFNENTSVFGVSVFLCLIFNASGCYFSEWDLDFLTDDLLPAMSPIIANTKSLLEDLFKINRPCVDYEDGSISSDVVADCMRRGRELARAAARRGNDLVANGVNLENAPPSMQQFFYGILTSEVSKASDTSHEMLAGTKLLQMKMCSGQTPNTFMAFLEHQGVRVKDNAYCKPVKVSCSSSSRKYRTIDGTCNNEEHPEWGRTRAPFTRLVRARYADGIFAMPVAKSGRQLPNTRVLSTRLFSDQPIVSRVLSNMNMQWGQFITHDLTLRAMEITDKGGIQCCLGNGKEVLPSDLLNDKCIPISVPEDDPFYRYHGIKCVNSVRSITAPRDDCSLGHAEQMNTVTSYLDGSMIYGSDNKLAAKLRSRSGGRLRQESRKGCLRGFLPSVKDKFATCDLRNSSDPCYLAGDVRINQTPILAMLQTLFLREHNRIADILSDLNPLWSDERLYQETRRIVIAEIQHITYQEWLPANFGEHYLRYYGISPSTLYTHDYSSEVNAGVINGFSAGAFRFLHSIITDSIMTCPSSYNAAYLYRLSDHYFNPRLLESTPESFDDIVRGILAQSEGESDPFFTGEITNLLFKSYNQWGLDLVAMDIQRGRDHGLASYNDYREICGLPKARCFQDLANEIPQDRITALQYLYECVDDIDMYVGGAMEREVYGSIVGPTFQCIIAEQFYRTRIGDRFFYDNGEMPHSFTSDQLKEIKKASLARVICDNTDGVYYVQRKAFEVESTTNPKYRCDDYNAIPYVDLTPWKKSSIFD